MVSEQEMIRNVINVMVNFKPGEYMGKIVYSVSDTGEKKNPSSPRRTLRSRTYDLGHRS